MEKDTCKLKLNKFTISPLDVIKLFFEENKINLL